MGWTFTRAQYYKKGKVDKIAEVKSEFDANKAEVLKASSVGNKVYVAVKDISNDENEVTAFVFLTSTAFKNDDIHNFSFKSIHESCGPCYYDCPASILKLLTPTSSKYAQEWRNKCWEQIELKKQKKSNPNSLSKLPVGTKIKMKYWEESNPYITLVKIEHSGYKRPIWVNEQATLKYSNKTIESQGFEIIS